MYDVSRWKSSVLIPLVLACIESAAHSQDPADKTFRAGAAAVDVTPTRFPVIVNGMFQERTADRAHDRLMARALVLDDGRVRLAIVVVDNLMMPRGLLDQAKRSAGQAAGIPAERILISATHTHSAPSAMGCLGSRADPDYAPWLPDQIAKAIALAARNLTAARVGWAVVQDPEHNHCRRWVFRPDRIQMDPFGQPTVRAHMHPGHQSPQHIGPAGPADPDLSLVSVQTSRGQPLAVLANYAMHYYGSEPVSGDFCGRFGDRFAALIGASDLEPPLVAMMSQGTSGDSMWMDYSRPAPPQDLDAYTDAMARVAQQAYRRIQYHDRVSLDMAERVLRLRRRVADEARLAWARKVVSELADRLPRSLPEIYARELLYLHKEPEVELKLQAVRIGELGITAIPNEVFGITGLKLKAYSPLRPTFNIELANGAEGYIPPPEQHVLGGYTTWPARTAGLEVQAEPKIVASLVELLETVSDQPRREDGEAPSEYEYARAVLATRPAAYWQLGELVGPRAIDAVGKHHGVYEDGVVFFLPGPSGKGFSCGLRGNRCVHLAGGRMVARVDDLSDHYTAEFWFWNGLPHDSRPVCAYLFSRGSDGAEGAPGDHLGIGGTSQSDLSGKLFFFNGNARGELLAGQTLLELKKWYHVTMTREGKQVRVYLNGQLELGGQAESGCAPDIDQLFFGGRSDNQFHLEGKLDEAAIYRRALSEEEAAAHYLACQSP